MGTLKDKTCNKKILSILNRIYTSEKTLSIQLECLNLARLKIIEGKKLIKKVICPALEPLGKNQNLKSKIREEALGILDFYDLKEIKPELVHALYTCLEDPDEIIVVQALTHLAHQFSILQERSLETEDVTINLENKPVTPVVCQKLLELLESSNEELSLRALECLQTLLGCLPNVLVEPNFIEEVKSGKVSLQRNVVDESEENLVGDLRKIIKNLTSLVLSEDEGEFKEMAHKCLGVIKEKNPKAIMAEVLEAKKSGLLKRWEYLNTLLHVP